MPVIEIEDEIWPVGLYSRRCNFFRGSAYMTPGMAFECLLVSHDAGLRCTMSEVFHNFSIVVENCLTASKACEIIPERNHDLVAIDWDGDASSSLLHTIWSSPHRRKPTILGISDDARPIPGAHFVLRKPVTSRSASESLKSAYPRMLLDYRLKARYAVMSRLMARDSEGQEFIVTVTDIGEGGMGLSSKEKLAVGDELSLALRLPQTRQPIHIQARIIWTREFGTVGCDFLNIPPVDRDILRDWLKAKTQVKKPLISV
jgi:Tfp pilus assembly protein PilZ